MRATEQEFREFVTRIFRGVKTPVSLSSEHIKLLTGPDEMKLYKQAFTTQDADSVYNYEYLEFRGDSVLGVASIQYLHKRFSLITSNEWMTRIDHIFVSKNTLGKLGKDAGFEKYITHSHSLSFLNDHDRLSLYEDVLEAFIGSIYFCCKRMFRTGTAYNIIYSIVSNLFDSVEVSLDYNNFFDSKSRLKEVYDSLGWPFKGNIRVSERRDGYVANVYGYPDAKFKLSPALRVSKMTYEDLRGYIEDQKEYGNFIPSDILQKLHINQNGKLSQIALNLLGWQRKELAYGMGKDEKEASVEAASYALRRLKRDGIHARKASPYIIPEGYPNGQLVDTSSIKEIFRTLLSRGNYRKKKIDAIMTVENLTMFSLSFSTPDWSAALNYNIPKAEGVALLKMSAQEWLSRNYPDDKRESRLTRMEINLLKKENMFKFATSLGLEKHFRYGKKVQKEIDEGSGVEKYVAGCFKACLGSIMRILTKNDVVGGRAVGYEVCLNIALSYFDELNFDSEGAKTKDPKSKLKEMYSARGWGSLRDNIKTIRNKTDGIFTVKITVPGDEVVIGKSSDKNDAENAAIEAVLKKFRPAKSKSPKNKLKEMYAARGWVLKDNITTTKSKKSGTFTVKIAVPGKGGVSGKSSDKKDAENTAIENALVLLRQK